MTGSIKQGLNFQSSNFLSIRGERRQLMRKTSFYALILRAGEQQFESYPLTVVLEKWSPSAACGSGATLTLVEGTDEKNCRENPGIHKPA
jgi:hypothetical protein